MLQTTADGCLPVTVLSKFRGAGTPTLLDHVLSNREGRRVAVIVDDMSEVNIDDDLVRGGDAALSRSEEASVEMTDGRICCTLRDDLLAEVRTLAEAGRFDWLKLVFIGMDEARIRRALDAALIPAGAFTPALWTGLCDPFPAGGERQLEAAA